MRERIEALVRQAEAELRPIFDEIDATAQKNTARVLDAFRRHRVSALHFSSTEGYGYDDIGRDTLARVWADVFGAEDALVRHSILSGTHALTITLFGLLRPGDILLAVTGKPYDTLDNVIGITDGGHGSLREFGVEYREVPLINGEPDPEGIRKALIEGGDRIKVAWIQRSKGYMDRKSLSTAEIGELIKIVKENSKAYAVVDNCYGEFVCDSEPTAHGADLCVGSLIKNPGGGIAETGGYIVGKREPVALCGDRYSAPGVGAELGASLWQNKSMFKGLFYAPHTVAQALKTAHLAARLFDMMGYRTSPAWDEKRADIIQTVVCDSAAGLTAFCNGIQHGSPVDAYVSCEACDMPGYNDPVIMAAGAFTMGASIELSCDGPMREPYIAFMQGGLTYESGRYAIISAGEELAKIAE